MLVAQLKKQFAYKLINPQMVRKRWIRKYYVFYVPKGWEEAYFRVFHQDKALAHVHKEKLWFGPFWSKKQAVSFGQAVKQVHNELIAAELITKRGIV